MDSPPSHIWRLQSYFVTFFLPCRSTNSLLQRAAELGATNADEAEEIEKERKVETDDREALQKARDFDDFKDGTHCWI